MPPPIMPSDVVVEVLRFLLPIDHAVLSLVCRRWHVIIRRYFRHLILPYANGMDDLRRALFFLTEALRTPVPGSDHECLELTMEMTISRSKTLTIYDLSGSLCMDVLQTFFDNCVDIGQESNDPAQFSIWFETALMAVAWIDWFKRTPAIVDSATNSSWSVQITRLKAGDYILFTKLRIDAEEDATDASISVTNESGEQCEPEQTEGQMAAEKRSAAQKRQLTNDEARLDEEIQEKMARREEGGDGLPRLNDIEHFHKKIYRQNKAERLAQAEIDRDEVKQSRRPKKNAISLGGGCSSSLSFYAAGGKRGSCTSGISGASAGDFRSKLERNELTETFEKLNNLSRINNQLLISLGVGYAKVEQICALLGRYGIHPKMTGAGGGGSSFAFLKPDLFIRMARSFPLLPPLSDDHEQVIREAGFPCTIYGSDQEPGYGLRNNCRMALLKRSQLSKWESIIFHESDTSPDEDLSGNEQIAQQVGSNDRNVHKMTEVLLIHVLRTLQFHLQQKVDKAQNVPEFRRIWHEKLEIINALLSNSEYEGYGIRNEL